MFNAFADFGDIKGECTVKDFKDQVQLTKIHFKVTQPPSITQQTAGGRSAEAAEFSEVTVEKLVDKASVKLWEASVSGKALDKVTITYTRSGGDSVVQYLVVVLKEVLINKNKQNKKPKNKHQFPIEQVKMTFGAIEKTYTQQLATGKAGGNVAAKWNVSQGAAA